MEYMNQFDHLIGLNHFEVRQSRAKHGSNVVSRKKRKGFWLQYLASFGDPIIKILLIALAINLIFLVHHSGWYESLGIAIAILLATFVSTLSEYGSEAAFEKLQQESLQIHCRVKRNGKLVSLPSADLVVGDIILLQAGERIPADGLILSGELFVDQSALNGESKEVRKYFQGPVSEQGANLGGEPDLNAVGWLFTGSVVSEGEGVMVARRVGDSTFYGALATEVQEETIDSPLRARLQKLAATISKLGYSAAAIVGLANLFNRFILDSAFDRDIILARLSDLPFVLDAIISTITLSVTVIVMAVPEGLPMMITVVLSANMKKMLKDNVLVRKLVGIETAGSLNILFTDKTGTLTEGKLTVTTFLDGNGAEFTGGQGLKERAPGLIPPLVMGCLYNTDAQISEEAGHAFPIGGNGTDRALLQFVLPYMNKIKEISLISHTPFHSRNKYSLSEIRLQDKTFHLIKGAPEILLPLCKCCLDEGGMKKPFSPAALQDKMRYVSERGVRMLALAQSESPIHPGISADLTLVGVACIRDDVRREAPTAIQQITKAGIQTVMITGDNKETAVAIAKEAGLLPKKATSTGVYTGKELSAMSDAEIKKSLPSMRVVARAMPTDKSRLVRLAQEMGLVAGMTGDGINDAPALKKADVGFSMGSGTEVAKEAGDIIIMDNNILSIAKAVLYGRTIFKSIRKFIIFQLTMNFCAVGLSIICPFLGLDAPLTVMQMLWVNMIMDTLAGLAFAGEAPQQDYMREPPKKRDVAIINRYMYSQILFMGSYITLLSLLFLKLPITQSFFQFGNGTHQFMTAFFALFIFSGVFNSINARTHRLNLLVNLPKNKMFIVIMILVTITQILLVYLGGTVFRTTAIPSSHLLLLALIALSVIPADMTRKLCLRSVGRKGHI